MKYTLGQKMFTPDDISDPGLLVNDRPYAGLLVFWGIGFPISDIS
ncbi:MAG: DUF2219 family protein [Ghiorsea sp.]|nr:DUF2219 family protein [Ghiorsea sp.]